MMHYLGPSLDEKDRQTQHLNPAAAAVTLPDVPTLLGDGRRFQQVLINLVKNALKFTKDGLIHIKACYRYEPENLLVLHVEDTGVGIMSQDFPKLFSRFGKLQRTASINSEGIGLGLTIVKQIVE